MYRSFRILGHSKVVKTLETQIAEAMKKGPRTVRIVFKDTHLDEIPLIINPTYNWDLLWYFID